MARRISSATAVPIRYRTGGAKSRADVVDQCDGIWLEGILADLLDAGGPLDAPSRMPTGQLWVSHGLRFFGITERPE